MKKICTSAAFIAFCFILACSKETAPVSSIPAPRAEISGSYSWPGQHSAMRLGAGFSQSIPVDTANSMITSYLGSVGYPSVDTALRSLSFDADTLRAYLQNPGIVTLKFMFAHQPAYKNSGFGGQYSGMHPDALTLVIVGLDNNDQYVLNNRSEVYEHFNPCPQNCHGSATAFIQ